MEHLKIKVIGVLREREELGNNSNSKSHTLAAGSAAVPSDGGMGAGSSAVAATTMPRPATADTTTAVAVAATAASPSGGVGGGAGVVRQLPKMSALDLAGILNCRRRLEWTKEWLRKNQTEFLSKENLVKEIQLRSNETYHLNCFFDITERQFRYLVTKLAPVISTLEPTRKKKSFSAEERIAITLKYLATGEVHSCRNYCFRASKPVILKMISDICLKMYELLKDQFLALPKTDEQWQNIANEIQRKDRLANCLGNLTLQEMKFYTSARATNSSSVIMNNSSSSQFDDEPDFAAKPPLIFSAILDANNNFMYVDVERTSAGSRDQIYEHSKLRQLIESKMMALPDHESNESSYFFAGCGSLPVKTYLLNSLYYVPTSQDMSYCFSNGGRYEMDYCYAMDTVNLHWQHALRMISNIFPVLGQPLRMEEEHARKITLGACALYNFLRKTDRTFFDQSEKMYLADEEEDAEEEEVTCANGAAGGAEDAAAREEERREREEFTPRVMQCSCFRFLHKQTGDNAAGLAKREWLMKYIVDSKQVFKQ